VAESLEAFGRRAGWRKSQVINTALKEWLQLEGHPRIRFVEPIPGERRAALVDGPEVWTVAEVWLQLDPAGRDVAAAGEATGLRADQVEAALAYWADNREEIDGLVRRIQAAQEQAHAAWARRRELDTLP
jgi:hypothetical protein